MFKKILDQISKPAIAGVVFALMAVGTIYITVAFKGPSSAPGTGSEPSADTGLYRDCPMDMVFVYSTGGGFCIDKYEASTHATNCPYPYPADQTETLANLDDSDCYAVSVSGRGPWTNIDQGQAALACAKAGKRLPTNTEWFYAALGTPDLDATDPADDSEECNIWTGSKPSVATYVDHDNDGDNTEAIGTGTATSCVSTAGAYDMVGNVWEWVADSTTDAPGLFTGEVSSPDYIKGVDGNGLVREAQDASTVNYNEDLIYYSAGSKGFLRSGNWNNGAGAGVFTLNLGTAPSSTNTGIGFRCAR